MQCKHEFLVLEAAGDIAVYPPHQFPLRTPIGRDAKRLGIYGTSFVLPPKIHLTPSEFDRWRTRLEGEGYTVTIGPFWTDPDMLEKSEEAGRRGETITLEEFRNELLRRAGGAGCEEDRRLESAEPPPS
jgi:hypothetical protein